MLIPNKEDSFFTDQNKIQYMSVYMHAGSSLSESKQFYLLYLHGAIESVLVEDAGPKSSGHSMAPVLDEEQCNHCALC